MSAQGQKAKSLPIHKMSAYAANADMFLSCSLGRGPKNGAEYKYCVHCSASQLKPYLSFGREKANLQQAPMGGERTFD